MGDDGNGNGSKVPAWMLVAAMVGGPVAGGAGGAKIANSWNATQDVPAILAQCLRRTDRLEWRIERLENRFPPARLSVPGMP